MNDFQPWVGVVTFAVGAALWFSARRERADLPDWFPRLAVGVMLLGMSTLAASRAGLAWSLVSIAFSLAAIVLLGTIVWRNLRRR